MSPKLALVLLSGRDLPLFQSYHVSHGRGGLAGSLLGDAQVTQQSLLEVRAEACST